MLLVPKKGLGTAHWKPTTYADSKGHTVLAEFSSHC